MNNIHVRMLFMNDYEQNIIKIKRNNTLVMFRVKYLKYCE